MKWVIKYEKLLIGILTKSYLINDKLCKFALDSEFTDVDTKLSTTFELNWYSNHKNAKRTISR